MLRRGITFEEEQRLSNWDWFIDRAGTQGLARLKKFIQEENEEWWLNKRTRKFGERTRTTRTIH